MPCVFLGVYVVGYIYRFIMSIFGKKVDAVEATTPKTDPTITNGNTTESIGNEKKCPFSTTATTPTTQKKEIDLDIEVEDAAPPCKT